MTYTLKYAIALAVILIGLRSDAQENVGGLPYSFRHGLPNDAIPSVFAAEFDAGAVAADDVSRARAGMIPFYARLQAVGHGCLDTGRWTELANGDRLWQLRVVSPGALATELFFSGFRLPAGAILYVYSDDGSEVLGGFTAYNNHPSGLFTTAPIRGEASIIEYFEPAMVRGEGGITVSSVGHAYRSTDGTRADACEVDVRCGPEGTGLAEERDGVVRISVVESGGLAWCSGSVMNNTQEDCTPYILTALHCGVNSTDADFNQYKFYFRYERSGCGTGTALASKVMTGCVRRADSNCGGGVSGSDFLLLEASNYIPVSYSPYFNGWDATGNVSNTSKCIHHPAGDEKKISTCTTATQSSQWGTGVGSHWRVVWGPTPNGWGVTEGGSSGSPLFDPNGLVIGTLTGGASCCTDNGCGTNTGPTKPDFFGKMSYHWGPDNPNLPEQELHFWLDSASTGATVFGGAYNPCNRVDPPEPVVPVPSAFPNPARDHITVVFGDDDSCAERVIMFDLRGRHIMDFTPTACGSITISTLGLAASAYFIEVFMSGSAKVHGPIFVSE
ncbi:MAG: hypothetical protein ABI599_00265 [Flavobacteriales bacterium]